MLFRFINRPEAIPAENYQAAADFIISQSKAIPGLKSIYRFGNITAAGISDLDLLFVFEDKVTCGINGFENLPEKYRKVFTHGIMALCESHFYKNHQLTLWSQHELVAGEEIFIDSPGRSTAADEALFRQTAIEFIVANYIDLKVQEAYRTFKLRSLLQHMKGISYDLAYLGIRESPLHKPLADLKAMILQWFSITPSDQQLNEWIKEWIPLYDSFSTQLLASHPMYLPAREKYQVAGNQVVINAAKLQAKRSGIILPSATAGIIRKYFNLQNKLNTFTFGIPLTSEPAHPILVERFNFLREMKDYNRRYLPRFMTMTTSITSKLI